MVVDHPCWFSEMWRIWDSHNSVKGECFAPSLLFQKRASSWEFQLLENELYDVLWCQMSSLVTPDLLRSFHSCPGSFSRSFIFDDFLWISGVLVKSPGGDCFAPLLIRRMSAPICSRLCRHIGSPLKAIQDICGAKHSPPGRSFRDQWVLKQQGRNHRKFRFRTPNSIQMKNSRFG